MGGGKGGATVAPLPLDGLAGNNAVAASDALMSAYVSALRP